MAKVRSGARDGGRQPRPIGVTSDQMPSIGPEVPPLSTSSTRGRLVYLGMLGTFAFLAGGFWDIAWHIDIGRDTFWSPPHLLLYLGISLIALVPIVALAIDRGSAPSGSARGRSMHPGMMVAGLGGLMALTAGPVDEFWHQMFGLDVTIWSPPHLQLIIGVVLAQLGLIATWVVEANHKNPARLVGTPVPFDFGQMSIGMILGFGLWLILLLSLITEYVFLFPMFDLAYHPIVLSALVGMALFGGARATGFAWGATAVAIAASVVLLVMLGFLVLLGRSTPLQTVILPAALVVDLLWTRRGQSSRLSAIAIPAVVSTTVLLASQLDYLRADALMPWPTDRLWVMPVAIVAGVLGAFVGSAIGWALRPVSTSGHANRTRHGPVGTTATSIALAFIMLGGTPATALAHPGHGEPVVDFMVPEGMSFVGRPTQFVVRIFSEDPVDPNSLEVRVGRAGQSQVLYPSPTEETGTYVGYVALPDRGLWSVRIRFEDGFGDRWVGWNSIRAATDATQRVSAVSRTMVQIQPDRTRALSDQEWLGFAVGHVVVTLWIVALLAGSIVALRKAASDGIALRDRFVSSG
jgi:hypothetical protein